MSNASIDKQIDTTVKILVALLTEPRIKSNELAEALGVSPNYIVRMIGRFRDAGLDISYDFDKQQYVGKFNEQMSKSMLGPYARKLKSVISRAEFSKPPVRFVSTLDRYTTSQFAAHMGVTLANVSNMLMGYKGQKLPAGWIGYQTKPNGRWFIQRAATDRSGKKYIVPDHIQEIAHKYVIGEGDAVDFKAKKSECNVPKCGKLVFARGLCSEHYYKARRHPEQYKGLIDD